MICFVNYSISPYHYARFKTLKPRLQEDIVFIELASRDRPYHWDSHAGKIEAVSLFPNKEFSSIRPAKMVSALQRTLDNLRPDTVLSISYASPAMRYAATWSRRNGAVSICVNDSWIGDKHRWIPFECVKGLWCRWAYDGMFVSGERCRDYYHGLGFPFERIWRGQNCVDNDYYAESAEAVRKKSIVYRQRYLLPEKFFLCVARLSREKNLERLIRAYKIYRENGGSWDLVLTGSGPEENRLKSLVRDLNLEPQVVFTGWKQVNEMPIYYGLASALILPSISEPWGNVVNEAMACGLPVLVSDKCGCQPELCFRGVNGYDFNPFSIEQMALALQKISSHAEDLPRMGQASRELIKRFSLDNYASSLADCIHTLKTSRKSRL